MTTPPVVLKLGGRVAAGCARRSRTSTGRWSSCAARRSPAEMERRGIAPTFVDGRRVTTPEVLAVVRESLDAVNAELCAAIGPSAVGLRGDEIGLEARQVEGLGLVGEPSPSAPQAVVERSRRGASPSSRRSRQARST